VIATHQEHAPVAHERGDCDRSPGDHGGTLGADAASEPAGRLIGVTHTHEIAIDADVVRKRFVSWSEGEADREWAGLTALAVHAPGLAPVPIARVWERDAPVVVMSRVPGESLGASRLTAEQGEALSSALRRLFSVPVGAGDPERAYGPSTMREGVRRWAAETYDLSACEDPGLVGRALAAARVWLAADDPHDRVIDRVAALGDGNLANVMWDGSICRLIDFEEYGASDLAFELADVAEHASSRLRRLVDAESLLAGFDLSPEQVVRLREFRRLLSTFWLVMLLPGNGGFARNPAGSTEDQARRVLELLGER
jgi:Ser/Thr protein kinase RdoA (MazF antagonist)